MAGLLDLPDEILIHILLFTSHCKILQVSDVHVRFKNLISNTLLWKNVDFSKPVSADVLRKSVKYLGKHTKSLRITGFSGGKRPKPQSNITDSFISTLKQRCTELDKLSFCNVWFNQPVRVDTFIKFLPGCITKLELNNCRLPYSPTREANFTHKLHTTNITSLSVINCKWLVCKDLIDAMCFPKLELLRLEESGNLSNVAHSVVIKTKRQRERAQKNCDKEEPLNLILSNCELKQALVKCLFTLTAPRIRKLTLKIKDKNKDIKVQELLRPLKDFKILDHLDISGCTSARRDTAFIQEITNVKPTCNIVI